MWTLSKHFKLSVAHSELEALVLERTAEMQKLSQRLLEVQDEERRKVARDLHDSTGQTLAALKISISFLEETCRKDPAALALIGEVGKLADQALGEIRTTSYLLHPPLLDEVGFACAAEWFIEGFSKRSGIKVTTDISNSRGRLPREVETALFRVLQESLINVHRHSGATEASIHFHREPETVILEVRGLSAEMGVGLAGMRERLHQLNGKLEIESDGNGTSMRATLPLHVPPLQGPFGDCAQTGASAVA
jgi:two-component system NarL family sensor kinase